MSVELAKLVGTIATQGEISALLYPPARTTEFLWGPHLHPQQRGLPSAYPIIHQPARV